jgi:hypothetical protein
VTSRYTDYGNATSELHGLAYSDGVDGKYETVDGVIRPKWNKFDARYWRSKRTKGISPVYGTVWSNCTSFPGSIMSANDELTLQSRLSEAVKGHQFNLAVSAAQGKQTVDMVVNAVTSIGGAISDLKKGRFESAARRFGVNQRPSTLNKKDVSGRWLELQYGWLPLMSDVQEAAKAFAALTGKPRTERVSVSLTRKAQRDSSSAPSAYSCKGTVEERWRILYEMSEQLSTPRSLGLTDLSSVVWELIPYSFVVDWFIPIGSYLENLNTIPQLRGRFLTIKVRRFQGSAMNFDSSYKFSVKPTEYVNYFDMSRRVSTSLVVPKPEFESLSEAMSPNRIYNSIALAVQRMR